MESKIGIQCHLHRSEINIEFNLPTIENFDILLRFLKNFSRAVIIVQPFFSNLKIYSNEVIIIKRRIILSAVSQTLLISGYYLWHIKQPKTDIKL